jgi:hypothetical protein
VRRGAALAAVLVVCLLIASLAGCGTPAVPPNTGIEGTVRFGPISPVSRPGEPDSRPYVAALVIKRLPSGDVADTVTSAADGTFRVALAPGLYRVEPKQGNPLPIAPAQEVTVTVGSFAHVDIAYDSGIR